jgi:hypothetical protein
MMSSSDSIHWEKDEVALELSVEGMPQEWWARAHYKGKKVMEFRCGNIRPHKSEVETWARNALHQKGVSAERGLLS